MKVFRKLILVFAVLISAFTVFATDFTNVSLETEIQIKQASANQSMYAWRDVLYVDTEIEEGSDLDYKVRASEIKKGYSNFELLQINGNSIKIDPKGKETVLKPGKIFTVNGGIIWVAYTAPDKKNYKLPTSIKIVPKKAVKEKSVVASTENTSKKKFVSKSTEPEYANPSFNELYFIRNEDSYPNNGAKECEYVDAPKQISPKNEMTNEQTVVKNLPAGTKSKLFILDTKEVLVYLAPDLTLRTGANSYTLFYASRRLGRDEPFSSPKRVMDNPKVNGKVCNIAEFTGDVYSGGGKKRLVLVWTQFTKPNASGISTTDLCRTTAIYSCVLSDDGAMKWEKPEVISEVAGALQFQPEIYNNGKTFQLCFVNRADNNYFSREVNLASSIKENYFVYDKNGKWKSTKGTDFVKLKKSYPFTDKNSLIPSDFEYVRDINNNICGAVYSASYVDEDDGETYINCFAKTYVKSPDSKNMVWTESVPVIYHKKANSVLYPSAVVRATGEWLVTYLNETEKGNDICVARVNIEPCLVAKTMVPNLDDMETPNGSMRFMIEVRNEGLAIAEGCDVIVRNEQNTEAGKITEKKSIYPGETYYLPGVYAKLRGKDGVVPFEKIKGDVKTLKAVKNSDYAVNKATFTLGIPHFVIGDIFVRTKGFTQTLYITVGTSNGVKVKAPGIEIVLTEHIDDTEDNVDIVPIDYDVSDEYFLVEYPYLAGAIAVPRFEVVPHVHFSAKSKHLPQLKKDEIEEITSCSSRIDIYNPLLSKEPVSGGVVETSFTKKTKVMKAELVVMNNWPEAVDAVAILELVNVNTGNVDQTLEVPFNLAVLGAKKITCEFGPAFSDSASDYTVKFRLKKDEVVASPVVESKPKAAEPKVEAPAPKAEEPAPKVETPAEKSEPVIPAETSSEKSESEVQAEVESAPAQVAVETEQPAVESGDKSEESAPVETTESELTEE